MALNISTQNQPPKPGELSHSGTVNVLDFGACPNGSEDASTAIQDALDSGARHVVIPGGEFLLKNALHPREGQALEIHGTLKIADVVLSPLTVDLQIGEDIVEVREAGVFWVGQSVMLYDTNLPIQGGGKKIRRQNAGCAVVEAVSGNKIKLSQKSARHYEVTAEGLLASVHSAIIVHSSGVHIFGSGLIDCNRRGQFNVCPGRLDRFDGVESIQGCGIAVAAFPARLSDIVIEGLTVIDPLLHGIRMKDCDRSVIRKTRCLRAHDKNITLERVRDCVVSENFACDSEWEDGIQFHQKADPELWSHRVRITNNVCAGNARVGIGVGAGMLDFQLAGNLCAFNGTNLSLRGDRITSIGDTAIGGNDRLFPFSGSRPNVGVAGRFIELQNLTALGTPYAAVGIGGSDITISGGRIGELDPPAGKDDGAGFDFFPMKRASNEPHIHPDRIVIQGVRVSGCRVVLRAAPGTGSIVLKNNVFPSDAKKWELPDELMRNLLLLSNEGWTSSSRGLARCPAGENRLEIFHGLCRQPDLRGISLTPGSPGAGGAFPMTVDEEKIVLFLPHPLASEESIVLWQADASGEGVGPLPAEN